MASRLEGRYLCRSCITVRIARFSFSRSRRAASGRDTAENCSGTLQIGCPGTIEKRSSLVWRLAKLGVERRLRVDLCSLFKRFMRQEASGASHVYALREGHFLKAKEC